MPELLQPKTYLVGSTQIENEGMLDYLRDTNQMGFDESVGAAKELHDGEILASMAAKLCYKSLVVGQNVNVTKTRDIPENLKSVINAGHSSVWGHVVFNFITTNCSRLFTHELIRHEVGTETDVPGIPLGLHEWSQTSGRYVRLEKIGVAWDPILEGCEDLANAHIAATEDLVYLLECRKGLRVPPTEYPMAVPEAALASFYSTEEKQKYRWIPNDKLNFDTKKKLTSAIRRFAMNGQVNEIFWSANLRALRHMFQMRTGRHAEWEIRLVFGQVYQILKEKLKIALFDAQEELVDGLIEVSGLKTQPYMEIPSASGK